MIDHQTAAVYYFSLGLFICDQGEFISTIDCFFLIRLIQSQPQTGPASAEAFEDQSYRLALASRNAQSITKLGRGRLRNVDIQFFVLHFGLHFHPPQIFVFRRP